MIPGAAFIRGGVAQTCIIPKFRWAAPFVQQPLAEVAQVFYRKLLRTACTWWCVARFWADRVLLHPNLAVAIQGLKTAAQLPGSAVLEEACRVHADVLQLEPVAGTAAVGFRVRPRVGANRRILEAARRAAAAEGSGVSLEFCLD